MTKGYSPGHPWFYVLGGKPLFPNAILTNVVERKYRGYLEADMDAINKKAEPQRSQSLRKMRKDVCTELFANLCRYRQIVRDLRRFRLQHGESTDDCADVHQAASLKYNHIFNDLAHLVVLNDYIERQPDLFDGI